MTEISTQHFINRELSWLQFNRRVLEEAVFERTPLLERAKFLAIVSSNLDEFFMVRMAGLHNPQEMFDEDPAGMSHGEQLIAARKSARELVNDQYRCCMEAVLPSMLEHGVEIRRPDAWTQQDRESLSQLFKDRFEPTLTPLAVDVGRPFPLLANSTIYIAFQLKETGEDQDPVNALVAVPRDIRLVNLTVKEHVYAVLEDLVEQFAASLFPGYEVIESCQIRVTRDGSLDIDEDAANDLLSEIEQELHHRSQGNPVRLEINQDAPQHLRDWVIERLGINEDDVFSINGFLDLTFLFGFYGKCQASFPKLCDKPHTPAPINSDWTEPFDRIREGELLLYHPYHSFQPIVDLVNRAAQDDQVLAIKMTLYRVSGNSPIVRSLIDAVHSGKQVTVLVELKARFDEQANIKWARRLEEAGAHVIYGLVGLKVHTKLLLIIRQDQDGIRRYCHIGTGNYNDKTAGLYTDYSFLTSDEVIGGDVSALFNVITGFAHPPKWARLAVSPLSMRSQFNELIDREIEHAKLGRKAVIKVKINSLVDEGITRKLYEASQAGVRIIMIIRGICILRPGVEGVSDNIEVRSVVGRFLEHSRFYYFSNDGDPTMLIGSADWMTRNLDRRIESLVQIRNPRLQETLVDLFDHFMKDNVQSRLLHSDGSYTMLEPAKGEQPFSAQEYMIEQAKKQAKAVEANSKEVTFTPQRSRKP